MRIPSPVAAAWVSVFAMVALAGAAAGAPFEWRVAAPASQGMSKEKLDALREQLAKRKTRAFLVIRNDRIVYEWYAAGHGPKKKHGTASLSKPIVAGLALALLLSDARSSSTTPVAEYVPAWNDDRRKRKITLRHLGSHTSGLADAEAGPLAARQAAPAGRATSGNGSTRPTTRSRIARDKTPVLFEPGTKLQYSNPGIAMLTYAVTAALKDGRRRRTSARCSATACMRPIGVPDAEWSVGYGKTFTVDGLPLVAGVGRRQLHARGPSARIGRLVLREGDWDGKQILSKEAVRQITGDAGLPGHCGMGFWTNADGRYARLPRDTYYGAGAGDQLLIVVPSLKLDRGPQRRNARSRAGRTPKTCSRPSTTHA